MELWSPPHDAAHLFEWWRPLLLASQQARKLRLHWPIQVDEFRLSGRVIRSGRPDVWIYEHHANGGALCVDHTGVTYKFVPTPRATGLGQFRPCDIDTAIWRAGLPGVVEPVWYDEPPSQRDPLASDSSSPLAAGKASDADDADDAGHGAGTTELREVSGGARPVRRGHLTILPGGR
jgi:hypothetical protein